jgi:sterol desaturase/sphingolipid hydroxylase (fatty acid hydroxylase superfamily)
LMETRMKHTVKRLVKSIYSYGFESLTLLSILLIWLAFHESTPFLNTIVLCSLAFVLMLFEWKFPYKKTWQLNKKEFTKDMFYQVGSYLVYGPVMVMLASQFFIDFIGKQLKSHQLALWPSDWPLLLKLGLALIVIEFFNYWFHRAEHYFSWLWPLHSVHHSPTKMGWSKNLINHPLEYFVLVINGVIPAAILGAGSVELEGAILIQLSITTFAHCNLNLNHRYVSRVLTTNFYHFRHHSPVLQESLSNFGCAILLWDWVFGTYQGFECCQRVGIEPEREYTLREELLLPFKDLKLGVGIVKGAS